MPKIEKILLIGASGFTGKRVISAIEKHNEQAINSNIATIELTIFCRPSTIAPTFSNGNKIPVVRGDLADFVSLKNAMHGQDGLLYAASLGFGHTPNVIKAAEEEKIKRGVFISTTAIFTKLNAPSKKIRMEAEAIIISSSLDWTILRPTMIFGRKGDRNMERLVKFLIKSPVLFSPGSGNSLQQPVFVDDVANSMLQSYFSKKAILKSYNISGKEEISFRQVVKTIAEELNTKRLFIPIPLNLCCFVLSFYEKLVKKPKLKVEQLLRLNENKAFSHIEAEQDFAYSPISFKDGINNLVKEIQKK